ncbi:MAG TPA: sigma 54-interacting transcriptional regulator, partial [Thermoanaerobaculia bacterium]|nr:sigma 54-interacting transcriptional regulator [Thermoanaerobaculia bacterium]
MGEVYRAEDLRLRQTVALKFLPERLIHNPEALSRFHQEVRLARQISHPNVCRVFDIHEAEGQPFLAMEYIDGEDLAALLRRIGRLPVDGGTLFLDEIGEIPPEVQPMLLRALEAGVVQRVGADDAVKVDVRIIAATDADLEQAIGAGRFRAPLLHRLGGYEIRLPPLRERRDDLGRLLVQFLRQDLADFGAAHLLEDPGPDGSPWLPASLVARFAGYSWPGNVRQLRNVARQLAVDRRGSAEAQAGPQLESLLKASTAAPAPAGGAEPEADSPRSERRFRSPREVSEDELVDALRANRWEPGAAAQQLGISRPAVYLLIDASRRVRKASDLEREEAEDAFRRCGGRFADMAALLEVSEEALKRRLK